MIYPNTGFKDQKRVHFILKQRKVDLPLSMLGVWTESSKEKSR
jgi:hypothetical protein